MSENLKSVFNTIVNVFTEKQSYNKYKWVNVSMLVLWSLGKSNSNPEPDAT